MGIISEPQDLAVFGFPGYLIYRDGTIWSPKTRGRGNPGIKQLDKTGCTQLQDSFGNYKRMSAKVLAFKIYEVPELIAEGFVPIMDGYYINRDGEVYSEMKAQKLIWLPNRCGYWAVNIHGKSYLVHRLVASVFVPNPEGYTEVDHIDANKSNNCASNLRWVNRSMNMKHAYQMGGLDDSLSKAFAAKGLVFTPKH